MAADEERWRVRRKLGHAADYLQTSPFAPEPSPRRIQQIIKAAAERAQIKKRVYPHLLRHSVATTLLERRMLRDQIQKLLGHSKLETTHVYAASTTEMMKESYRKALAE